MFKNFIESYKKIEKFIVTLFCITGASTSLWVIAEKGFSAENVSIFAFFTVFALLLPILFKNKDTISNNTQVKNFSYQDFSFIGLSKKIEKFIVTLFCVFCICACIWIIAEEGFSAENISWFSLFAFLTLLLPRFFKNTGTTVNNVQAKDSSSQDFSNNINNTDHLLESIDTINEIIEPSVDQNRIEEENYNNEHRLDIPQKQSTRDITDNIYSNNEIKPSSSYVKKETQVVTPIDITTCTLKDILTLEGFDTDLAQQIITARDSGKMWYNPEEFLQYFKLQPHFILVLEKYVIFPNKIIKKNRVGRKVDW